MTESAPLLRVEGLNVAYGDVQVLWDVNLVVYPGETVALVGANGAGKSTLMNVLGGLVARDAGRIAIAGQPADIRSPADLKQPVR